MRPVAYRARCRSRCRRAHRAVCYRVLQVGLAVHGEQRPDRLQPRFLASSASAASEGWRRGAVLARPSGGSASVWESRNVRCTTLNFMVNILEKTSAAEHKTVKEEPASRRGPGGDGDDIAADGAANTTGYGWSTCF